MSNIQLHQPQITQVVKNGEVIPVTALTVNEQVIVNTFANPTIRKFTETELLLALNDVLSACYFDLGYKQPNSEQERADRENEIWIMVKSIAEELKDKFYNSLRVNEVKIAVKKGSLGNYNSKEWQFIGVNVANVIKSIRAYLSDLQRNQDISLYLKLTANTETKEPTEAEKFELMKSNSIRCFEMFKDKKDIDLFSLPVYEFLDKLKLIPFDSSEKEDFINEARQALITETQLKASASTNMDQRRALQLELKNYTEGGEKQLVIAKAKKLALKSYFQSLIMEEEDLNTLILENYQKVNNNN